MTPERWQVVRGILQSAMELRPQERAAYLDRQCVTDPSLHQDVDEYLSIERNLDTDFLESPAVHHVELAGLLRQLASDKSAAQKIGAAAAYYVKASVSWDHNVLATREFLENALASKQI